RERRALPQTVSWSAGVSVFSHDERVEADGGSFCIHEWRGSGPPQVHVHDEDDEAWHVLEGTLRFRLGERTVDAGAGATVFVPARVPHTYEALPGSRYLIMLAPPTAAAGKSQAVARVSRGRRRASQPTAVGQIGAIASPASR